MSKVCIPMGWREADLVCSLLRCREELLATLRIQDLFRRCPPRSAAAAGHPSGSAHRYLPQRAQAGRGQAIRGVLAAPGDEVSAMGTCTRRSQGVQTSLEAFPTLVVSPPSAMPDLGQRVNVVPR